MFFFYASLALYLIGMLFIFLYSLSQAHLLFHYLRAVKSNPENPHHSLEELPMVTIQLPIYNEKYVVERLIAAVATIQYPKHLLEIQILDDSTDESSVLIQEKLKMYPEINFQYHPRSNREGYKAGALVEGLLVCKGEFIAIFDADFIPDTDFLMRILPYFNQSEIGMVQTRWTHLNKNYSWMTKLQAFALDAHFVVEQIGRNAQGAFINFNGTAGIWRKTCIEDAGGWSADTLTEDLDLSYRAQKKGWKFVYDSNIESPAELPPIMSAIKSQQFRWTKGGAECAAKHLKSVWTTFLPLKTKLHATAHLLNSTIFIAVFLVSMCSIPLSLYQYFEQASLPYFSFAGVFFFGFLIIAAVYYFANLLSEGFSIKNTFGFIGQLFLFLSVSMGLALHNSLAVWEGWTGKKSPFVRTPKFNISNQNEQLKGNIYQQLRMPAATYFELILALIFAVLIIMGIYFQQNSFLIFHLMLLIGYGSVGVYSFVDLKKTGG